MSLYAGTTNVDKYHFQVTFPQPPSSGLAYILGRTLLIPFPSPPSFLPFPVANYPADYLSVSLSREAKPRTFWSRRRGCRLTSDVRQDAISRSPLLRPGTCLFFSVPRQRSFVAKGGRGEERKREEEKLGTSPIESHLGARLIYFFLLLVRMQMAAPHRVRAAPLSTFFQHPVSVRVLGTVPLGRSFIPVLSLFLSFSSSRISIPLICLALIVRET